MNAAKRSAHQLQCIGEKFRPAEIARFQCKQHRTVFCADRAQNRHACSDFRANDESGNPEAIDDSADRARVSTFGKGPGGAAATYE